MKDNTVRSIVLVAAFTALIIVGAIFSFPAPWNPVVPFTLATLFVILAGMLLGPWRGLGYWCCWRSPKADERIGPTEDAGSSC